MQAPIDNVLSRLERVRKSSGSEWKARCPAHPDRNPSLSIRWLEGDRMVLIHCHAGCPTRSVLDAIGLTLRGLYGKK